ncbi:hypothetical protein [Cryobacterium sp. RTS3]|uniref:hypothetical protein n=1 Tax=Cryobacterium sp. RTS3 TaxID=3048643 RepID=UPI002B229EF0|nr:hypothetical protein [Cryobacterium sp. RTS3]
MPVETSTERVRATQGTGRSGRWPNWTLGLIVAAFAVATIFGTAGDVSSLVLGFFALWIPVAVCWIAIGRARSRRKDLYLMSAAVTILAAGDTFFALATTGGNSLSNPSWADVGFLGFYPLMFTALVVLARRNIRGLASPIVLDSAVGSLGAAALLAVLLDPILKAALAAPGSFATTVAFAYPLGDVLLIAFFVGIAASHGTSIGPGWTLLVLGLAVFTAADIISVSLHLNGLYVLGTALDVGWPLSPRPDRVFGRQGGPPRLATSPVDLGDPRTDGSGDRHGRGSPGPDPGNPAEDLSARRRPGGPDPHPRGTAPGISPAHPHCGRASPGTDRRTHGVAQPARPLRRCARSAGRESAPYERASPARPRQVQGGQRQSRSRCR